MGRMQTDRDRRITIQTLNRHVNKTDGRHERRHERRRIQTDLFTQLPTALQVREEDRERIDNAFNPNPFSVVIV